MVRDYRPDIAYDVTLWKGEGSSGTISLGLGLNTETRQLLFYLGNLTSEEAETWWLPAERHLLMLDFLVGHRIFFDGKSGEATTRQRNRRGNSFYDIHFDAESYPRFKTLLDDRVDVEPDKRGEWVSPKKLWALVEIIALIINQTDLDTRLEEDDFGGQWDHFLDLLENERSQ